MEILNYTTYARVQIYVTNLNIQSFNISRLSDRNYVLMLQEGKKYMKYISLRNYTALVSRSFFFFLFFFFVFVFLHGI